jgi:superfamily I DNA/RNA helicase
MSCGKTEPNNKKDHQMSHLIILDEPAIKEIVESNIYQSREFDSGESLGRALLGDQSAKVVSARIVPTWHKECLYLLNSRIATGYLVIDSEIFKNLPLANGKHSPSDDVINVFQRACRFALKEWNGLSFAFSEMWSPTTGCGVVFPYPKSRHVDFRVTLKRPDPDRRIKARHGEHQLFAFAAGTKDEKNPTADQMRSYKRAFDELGLIRTSLEVQIKKIETTPDDKGYHPLVLSGPPQDKVYHQSYEQWASRLTKTQKDFVTYNGSLPQRVEGAAGTGKTLSLILRAHFLCMQGEAAKEECRVIFIAHSDATRQSTLDAFNSLGEPFYHLRERTNFPQSIELCTLQQWCGAILGSRDLGEAQYLDQDALSAKELRRLLLQDLAEKYQKGDRKLLEYLSEKFRSFFENENPEYLAELLQHEIGVMIKGRATEDLDSYLGLPMLSYCLPTIESNDRRFVYGIYKDYQKQLNSSGVFDTDDIVLSTLGRLNTPIWRRRRKNEGFDYVIIDETHLFNFNELSLFHHLLRCDASVQITFAIDRSQAPGNRGITGSLIREVLIKSPFTEESTARTDVVFRSSPQIVRLAEAITASGATLFTTFENPLHQATSVITASDEAMTSPCVCWESANDEAMCEGVIRRMRQICNELKCRPSEVLIVATTEDLIDLLRTSLKRSGEVFVVLSHRGDLEAVKSGFTKGAVILSHPDYVGGLEFKAVLITGVCEGRLPPTEGLVKEESRHFIQFKACNRLYVAITRARLRAELFYSAQRGRSSLLDHAVQSEAVDVKTF